MITRLGEWDKILCNFEKQADHLILARRPDQVKINKKTKKKKKRKPPHNTNNKKTKQNTPPQKNNKNNNNNNKKKTQREPTELWTLSFRWTTDWKSKKPKKDTSTWTLPEN